MSDRKQRWLIGWATLVASLAYLSSDLWEWLQGGFSPAQLSLTHGHFNQE